jgi:menaquinone-dependent protoporphyrinogen oxidase
MARIMIVYGTRPLHTADLSDRIAETLRSTGHEVDVFNLHVHAPRPLPRDYDAVVVGASVHAGAYEREVRRWVRSHAGELTAMPNAFFSVSLASANHDERSNAEIASAVGSFEKETGWRPARVEELAGALVYSKYNWILRRMRRIVTRHVGVAPVRLVADLTDYAQVDAFARTFGDSLVTTRAVWRHAAPAIPRPRRPNGASIC